MNDEFKYDEIQYVKTLATQGWKAALIDLDGTLYRGDQGIEGAGAFVNRLRENGVQPVFFTNNSTRTPQQVADKLRSMDIGAAAGEVCTSSQMAAFTLRRQVGKGRTIAALGQAGLKAALEAEGLVPIMAEAAAETVPGQNASNMETAGIEAAGAVVGLDLRVTYEQLAWICNHVSSLSSWILTNGDVRLPHGEGFLPGNGAIGAFISAATGVKPQTVGKPNPDYVDFVLKRFRLRAAEAVVIGDNLLTDIACGNEAKVKTIWVQSGVTYEDNEVTTKGKVTPDFKANSVADLFWK